MEILKERAVQRYREKSWFKRCVSYAARAYGRQNRRWENYDVPPVYLIGLMDTEIRHPDKEFWRGRQTVFHKVV